MAALTCSSLVKELALSQGRISCSPAFVAPGRTQGSPLHVGRQRRVKDSNLRDHRGLRVSSAAPSATRPTLQVINQRRVRDSNSQGTFAPCLFSRQVPYQLG